MTRLSDAAEEVLTDVTPRKRGRPKGSKNKPREPTVESEYVPNESSIALCSMLADSLWNISRRFSGWSELAKEEKRQLGETIDPLLHKYLPMMDRWREESAFVFVLVSVIGSRIGSSESKAEVVEVPLETTTQAP